MKMISASSFARIARSLARKNNVTVRFDKGATTAATNGKIIYLPLLKQVTKKVQDTLLGYLLHEVGHVKYTNFNVENKHFVNLFEDHRIERLIRHSFGGGEETLLVTHKSHWNDVVIKIPNYETSTFGAVSNWLLGYGQKVTMQRNPPLAMLENCDQQLEKHWGKIQNKLFPFLEKSKFTSSSEDVAIISDEVVELLKALQPEEEKQQKQSSDPNSEASAFDDCEDESSDENEESSLKSNDEAGISGEDKYDSNVEGSSISILDLEASQKAFEEALRNGEQSPDFGDEIMDSLKDLIQEAEKKGELLDETNLPAAESFSVGSTDLDYVEPDANVLQEVVVSSYSLRLAIKRMTEDVSRNKPQASQRGRCVDRKRLSRIALGNPKVFMKKTEKVAINAAVTIALDLSGSMAANFRAKKALAAMLGLAQALYSTKGSTVRGTIFPGKGSTIEQVITRRAKPDEKIAGLHAHGGTPIVEAILEAHEELLEQPEQKKILFCITDGAISQEQFSYINGIAEGIKIYWIGIGIEALPFTDAICVDSAEQLGSALLKYTHDMLFAA